MIAKERLEDIKERFAKYQTDYNLNGEDVEWLIQQAERIEELEKEKDEWKYTAQSYYFLYILTKKLIKRFIKIEI